MSPTHPRRVHSLLSIVCRCGEPNELLGSEWLAALVACVIGYSIALLLSRRLKQLQTTDRAGYASDLMATNIVIIPGNALYQAIIILVDTDLLSPHPWYTIASALLMSLLTFNLFKL